MLPKLHFMTSSSYFWLIFHWIHGGSQRQCILYQAHSWTLQQIRVLRIILRANQTCWLCHFDWVLRRGRSMKGVVASNSIFFTQTLSGLQSLEHSFWWAGFKMCKNCHHWYFYHKKTPNHGLGRSSQNDLLISLAYGSIQTTSRLSPPLWLKNLQPSLVFQLHLRKLCHQ